MVPVPAEDRRGGPGAGFARKGGRRHARRVEGFAEGEHRLPVDFLRRDHRRRGCVGRPGGAAHEDVVEVVGAHGGAGVLHPDAEVRAREVARIGGREHARAIEAHVPGARAVAHDLHEHVAVVAREGRRGALADRGAGGVGAVLADEAHGVVVVGAELHVVALHGAFEVRGVRDEEDARAVGVGEVDVLPGKAKPPGAHRHRAGGDERERVAFGEPVGVEGRVAVPGDDPEARRLARPGRIAREVAVGEAVGHLRAGGREGEQGEQEERGQPHGAGGNRRPEAGARQDRRARGPEASASREVRR